MATETHAAPSGSGTLSVTIVSPGGKIAEGAAQELVAPGVLGEFGVLPGHVPLLAALRAGVLTYREGGHRHVIAVDKGFLQVGAENRVVVLVEAAMLPGKIDLAAAQAEVATQSGKLKAGGMDPAEQQIAQDRLAWAEARVAVAGGAGKPAADAH